MNSDNFKVIFIKLDLKTQYKEVSVLVKNAKVDFLST